MRLEMRGIGQQISSFIWSQESSTTFGSYSICNKNVNKFNYKIRNTMVQT